MNKILIIKMSSLGDVIHALPALTDARNHFPEIQFDWVVEENFAEIPKLHPAVNNVIPISLRKWRKNIFSQSTYQEWHAFKQNLQQNKYDMVIDAQGLLKSALIAKFAKGVRCGFNSASAREFLASIFYHKKISVKKNQHAILRNRMLFGNVFGYTPSLMQCDYGIKIDFDQSKQAPQQCHASMLLAGIQKINNYVVFLHGTTWKSKLWPEHHWIDLAKSITQKQIRIKIPWGNQSEFERANRIAKNVGELVEVLPRSRLTDLAAILKNALAVVSVDTGLGHLSAALDIPTISLYGPTNPELIGTQGKNQIHLCSGSKNQVNVPVEKTLLELKVFLGRVD